MKSVKALLLTVMIVHTLSKKIMNKRSNDIYEDFRRVPKSSKVTPSTTEGLFSKTGYPEPGDIPILNRKVFRAKRVSIQEHPYIVSIRRNFTHYLTGSLIQANLVVTVAHAIKRVPTYELGVVLGQTYNDRGTHILTVILIFVHRLFDPYTLENDVALLRFYENVVYNKPFTANVKEIRIAYHKIRSNEKAHATGWGRCDMTGRELCLPRSSIYYPDEVMDPMLRSIKFDLKEVNLYCKGYEQLGVPLTEEMFCAGQAREEFAPAPCLAVPGAALVSRGKLLGVASWGFGCGFMNDLPLIYTDLRKYYTWIVNIVKTLKKIPQANLTQIFEATRAYAVSSTLSETRVWKKHYGGNERYLAFIPADLYLIELWQTTKIYDLRNFVYSRKFHEAKKALYTKLTEEPPHEKLLGIVDRNHTRVEHAEL